MESHRLSFKEWGARAVLALVFVALGLLLYVVFSPLRPMLDKTVDYLGRIGLTAGLLVAVWLAGRNEASNHIDPAARTADHGGGNLTGLGLRDLPAGTRGVEQQHSIGNGFVEVE